MATCPATEALFVTAESNKIRSSQSTHLHSINYLEPVDIFFEPLDSKLSPVIDKSRNMTCGHLGIDEACIIIKSNVDKVVKFQYQSMECDNCSYLEMKPLKPFEEQKLIIKFASFGTMWQVSNGDNKSFCSEEQIYLGESSWYHINVNNTGCSLVCDKQPENVVYPILIALGFYALLFFLAWAGKLIYRSRFFNNVFHRKSLEVSTELAAAYSSSSTIEEKKKPHQQRLRSLDTVRGLSLVIMIFVNYGGGRISIVVMIFVNYGGGSYTFFNHSHWNGLTVADLVFPWFIWMMGMSMAISMKSQLRKIVSKKKIFLNILRRSIILFSLGIMLNTLCLNVNLLDLRVPGVLQRFGVSYFVVATAHLFFASADEETAVGYSFKDLVSYKVEWLIMLMCLAMHLVLMFVVHSPDCPRGYFGPGGLHDHGLYENCTGGAAAYIDTIILGSRHLYQHPESKAIYHSVVPCDPEGILGYFTSIFLVFLGLQAGKILLMFKDPTARMVRWTLWGIFTGMGAGILCCFSKNDGWIPVNKNLWSLSFILATGSLAFILLTMCYFVIDVKKYWSGAPFYHAGMNSILLYVGHEVTHNMFPWSWQVQPTHMHELFMDLWGTSLWVLIAVYMHYKNNFIAI
ncbi:hypothetical protein JTE90_007213 [Oedothorax gibbosus]|uniref:DUF5009 domain-containing protein n=1 Tax=Oedothorax gibbosus TaxID=931172 RepID=A0AAV6VPM1_9ARAC|nr:hypothetical protein JTE90_007213 [Oedothorax gibbosus]